MKQMRIGALVAILCVMPLVAACVAPGQGEPGRSPAAATDTPAGLAREQRIAMRARGNAAAGEVAFEVCEGCHRHAGAGRPNGSYPRLAGQHPSVLIKQVYDIRAGRRPNHKMLPFADEDIVGPKDIADIAAYLRAQPVKADNGRGPGTDLGRGQVLYERDCARCHGTAGQGDGRRAVPRLSGQHYLYLLRAARAVRDGERGNSDPEMAKVIGSYTEAELEAVSDFASRLPVG